MPNYIYFGREGWGIANEQVGFGYHSITGLSDPRDPDDNSNLEDDIRLATSLEEGGDLRIYGVYERMTSNVLSKRNKTPASNGFLVARHVQFLVFYGFGLAAFCPQITWLIDWPYFLRFFVFFPKRGWSGPGPKGFKHKDVYAIP